MGNSLLPYHVHPSPFPSKSEPGITVVSINPQLPPSHNDSFATNSESIRHTANKSNSRQYNKVPNRKEFHMRQHGPLRQRSEPGLSSAPAGHRQQTVEEIQMKLRMKQAMSKKQLDSEAPEDQLSAKPAVNSQIVNEPQSSPQAPNESAQTLSQSDNRLNMKSPNAHSLKSKLQKPPFNKPSSMNVPPNLPSNAPLHSIRPMGLPNLPSGMPSNFLPNMSPNLPPPHHFPPSPNMYRSSAPHSPHSNYSNQVSSPGALSVHTGLPPQTSLVTSQQLDKSSADVPEDSGASKSGYPGVTRSNTSPQPTVTESRPGVYYLSYLT